MKKSVKKVSLILALGGFFVGGINAQEKAAQDTTKVKEGDRNMMLNAASANSGPREVNVGLPATVGGTTVLENNLPVVYFYWPEFPYKSWRMDAMTNGVKVRDLGQTAIHVGDVGFSMDTYDNLGTDNFRGSGSLGSNHFGLIKQDFNVSGPLGNGFKFSLGTFINFDPGTYKNKYTERYYSDQTVLLKGALSKDYTFGNGKGSIALMYKYASSKGMSTQLSAPYIYKKDGSVKELDGFKIGGDSYVSGQTYDLLDSYSGKRVERDALNDYGSETHTIDLIGKNNFDNGLYFNYIVRAHSARTGAFLPVMTGVSGSEAGKYTYADTGEEYTGNNVQTVMVIASRKTPIKSLTSTFEVGKKSGRHSWNVGLNAWVYDINKFLSESTMFYQEVSANPRRLVGASGSTYFSDGNEYHDGTETKTALFATDKWEISDVFTLNLGARLEYQALRGNYIDKTTIVSGIPYMDNKKTDIDENFLNKAFMASAVYKMTRSFGLLGELTYNEQAGHLENYSAGNYPDLKHSKIPGATLGLFYNHPMVSVVSKATYIQKDNYRSTVNFTNPNDISQVNRAAVKYDIQTIGWTTDVVATPFKNFNLHFLLTVQSPKYKNYAGTVEFASGNVDYSFNDKIVNKVSKVLIEIDPSYQWEKVRIWASARYFSKTYANLSNSLQLASRWETFAGLNYSFNKNLDFSATFVNLLNQRGAQGTISGTDLLTDEQVDEKVGADGIVVSGTYIRPFTAEFGIKYRF
ncbi:TonB-dependent receptor [Dysgonomonas macrotermitis]|uniref:Outer membrane receptor proteins, mostly Fe transport n=1 Tax=Dysgonomonas macrotermitis TaxID=1346286 RepID=A0A1M5EH44_9BACT|nr:TonB-dependent receptor [Dysgonomonas macrotermitis]SHF78382.1 hypothetical protein SAMN05444362_11030 [Dysgonomonas macrotermitis]